MMTRIMLEVLYQNPFYMFIKMLDETKMKLPPKYLTLKLVSTLNNP
jgi:hypothetical protein